MTSLTVLLFVVFSLAVAVSFRTVIVPATFDEWEREGTPSWANNSEALRKHGLSVYRYQKLDPSAPHYFGYNRGTETGVYLKYIVDHYHHFPDVAVFVHAHPQGHNKKWLEMVQCVSPNATYYNLNYGQSKWTTRDSGYWYEYKLPTSSLFQALYGCVRASPSQLLHIQERLCGDHRAVLERRTASADGAKGPRRRVPRPSACIPTDPGECHMLQPVHPRQSDGPPPPSACVVRTSAHAGHSRHLPYWGAGLRTPVFFQRDQESESWTRKGV